MCPSENHAAAKPISWITHEFSPFHGGAGVYAQEIARAAAGLPTATRVLTVDYRHRLDPSERAAMVQTDSTEPFPVVRLKCSGRLTPAGIGRLAAGTYRQRAELQKSWPVLVSVGAQMAAFLLHAIGQFPTAQTTCVFHGSEHLRFARHPLWRRLARRFFARAAGFVVSSQYAREIVSQSGLLPPAARILLAPCAVPSTLAQAAVEDAIALAHPPGARKPEGERTIRVLTVARLHPRKGQVQVAEALALLPTEQRRRVVYRLVGSGDESYRRRIEAVCQAGGFRCEFLGAVDDRALPRLYTGCTVYAQASQVLPASVEGFGISLLEAGFFGCPIAAFRSGGVSEAVIDGRSATLVAEGDVPALSAAIGALISDPDLRRAYGDTGRLHARSFSWQKSARELCDFVRGC